MIGLALLSVLGLALIATSARLLHDPTSEAEPEASGVSWMDALIFLLCLAGILAQRANRDDEDD